jgi:hypothetical protein
MIPGANLLAMALSIMEPAAVLFYPFISRNVNAIGLEVSTYGEPVTLEGSVQAMPRSEYEQLGLDLAREYITFYAQANMQNSGRDRENDYLAWDGFRWDIVNVTAWHGIDGWSSVLAVKVGPLP